MGQRRYGRQALRQRLEAGTGCAGKGRGVVGGLCGRPVCPPGGRARCCRRWSHPQCPPREAPRCEHRPCQAWIRKKRW
jgi:hypothetical protein